MLCWSLELVGPSPGCLKVYSGFEWADGVLLFYVLLSNQARMVIALSGIRVNQESLQLNNPCLLAV